jgi:hypothetical protein
MGSRAAVLLGCSFAAALVLAAGARAAGGRYVFDGGTPAEQAQVGAALDASSFDWDIVPSQVTIHIVRGLANSYSTRGQIWLDANVLDAGAFSWGVVQMEYGQQVQFALLNEADRAWLTSALGAQQWCYENPSLPRGDNGCERFAATLAWAYWPSPQNSMRPAGPGDWSASMNAADFRALLAQMIGAPDTIATPAFRRLAGRSAARAPVYPHGH